jgi:hypothetical protein
MKAIPAEVIAAERQGDQYRVAVRIGGGKYRGSFNTLVFGEVPDTQLDYRTEREGSSVRALPRELSGLSTTIESGRCEIDSRM